MNNSDSPNKEATDEALIENINQLSKIGFGTEDVACHVCGETLREGETVVTYAVRLKSASSFTIGQMFCQDHGNAAESTWSRRGRELIVQGRVGTVSNAAEHSSWPVLLYPEVLLVSPIGAVEAYTPTEYEKMRTRSRRVGGGGVRPSEDNADASNEKTTDLNELAEPVGEVHPRPRRWIREATVQTEQQMTRQEVTRRDGIGRCGSQRDDRTDLKRSRQRRRTDPQ